MKTKIESVIYNVEEIVDGIVRSAGQRGAKISIPEKFMDKKVKILVLKEKGEHIGFRKLVREK